MLSAAEAVCIVLCVFAFAAVMVVHRMYPLPQHGDAAAKEKEEAEKVAAAAKEKKEAEKVAAAAKEKEEAEKVAAAAKEKEKKEAAAAAKKKEKKEAAAEEDATAPATTVSMEEKKEWNTVNRLEKMQKAIGKCSNFAELNVVARGMTLLAVIRLMKSLKMKNTFVKEFLTLHKSHSNNQLRNLFVADILESRDEAKAFLEFNKDESAVAFLDNSKNGFLKLCVTARRRFLEMFGLVSLVALLEFWFNRSIWEVTNDQYLEFVTDLKEMCNKTKTATVIPFTAMIKEIQTKISGTCRFGYMQCKDGDDCPFEHIFRLRVMPTLYNLVDPDNDELQLPLRQLQITASCFNKEFCSMVESQRSKFKYLHGQNCNRSDTLSNVFCWYGGLHFHPRINY